MSPSSSYSMSTSELFLVMLALKKHITPLKRSNNDFKLSSLSLFLGLLSRASPSSSSSTSSLSPHYLWSFSQTYFPLQLQTVRGGSESSTSMRKKKPSDSRIQLNVNAGLKRRLTDIQILTQSIRSMLCVCLLSPSYSTAGCDG